MATAFPSGLDLVQSYSLYIHAKHCCGVHYLNSALFRTGPRNFSRCALWFLLSAVSDRSCLFSPYTVISLSPPGHSALVYEPLVTFPHCQCILSLMAHYTQVLKEFSTHTHKAMPITFLLLSSSQGTQKTSCFNIKLPRSEIFFSPLCPSPQLFWVCAVLSTGAAASCDHSSHELQGCWKRSSPKIKPVWKIRQGSKPLPYTVGTLDIKATRKMLTYPVMQTLETPKIIVTHQTLHYFP